LDPVALLLLTAFRHTVSEPNVEAGCARVQELAGQPLSAEDFHTALATCLRDGLIREPVRLPEGALQCHWRLELTPAGAETTRRIIDAKAS
jgi:hypothetical protein